MKIGYLTREMLRHLDVMYKQNTCMSTRILSGLLGNDYLSIINK